MSVVGLTALVACSPGYIEPISKKPESTSVTLRDSDTVLTADKEPLIVVNGVIVKKDVLTSMDPNDIASISVLKGASAAAIYGERSKNGVVVITLKSKK